jgi:hypothetical protein
MELVGRLLLLIACKSLNKWLAYPSTFYLNVKKD